MNAQLFLRRASMDDLHRVFEWRNRPDIVALGKAKKTVTLDEHSQWFEGVINQTECHVLYIVMLGQESIGQVRFDRISKGECEVSIYLLPEFCGFGYGVVALQKACRKIFIIWEVLRIIAIVLTGNTYSVSAFKKSGFKLMTDKLSDAGHIKLQLKKPPVVSHNQLTFGDEEVDAVSKTIRSGYWASGSKVKQLEHHLKQIAGVRHAVCVSSGLSALRLVLRGYGVGKDDKVIVPGYSCVALANAVLACGASPITADITEGDWNISLNAIKDIVVSNNAKAIIAVNTFGAPANIEEMLDLNIPVIEDCAHAFGLSPIKMPFGGRSEAAIISFYASKLIGAGEGGAVLTNDDSLADYARQWRDYGDQPADGMRLNEKMTDIEASLALCQLDRLPTMINARRRIARRYCSILGASIVNKKIFNLPKMTEKRIWYRFVVEMVVGGSEFVIARLEEHGIKAARPVTDWRTLDMQNEPMVNQAYQNLISLPIYPSLTSRQQEHVIGTFIDICEELNSG